jgi:hypothetical protein
MSVERVEGREPVNRLEVRSRYDNFVSDPRKDGTEPTRELPPRLRSERAVRVARVEGISPESWLVEKDKEVIFDKPPISEGREPVKDFEDNESETTSPDTEQVKPGHTGEEHLLATLAQLQAGIMDWMLVLLMRAHRAKSSVGKRLEDMLGEAEGEIVGESVGARLGDRVGITVGRRVGMIEHSC